MTISEALISLNSFPIPTILIDRIGIERGLDVTLDYSLSIADSSAYELATADVYFWLSSHVDLDEQDVSITQQEKIKDRFLSMANTIYKKYEDSKYTGNGTFGFKGDEF